MKVTRPRVYAASRSLNRVAGHAPKRMRGRIYTVMRLLDDIGFDLRREAIFAAGARARTFHCRFEGHDLGSAERLTFAMGYRSTHPDFTFPGL